MESVLQNLWTLVTQITVVDVIDIALVTYILYQVLLLIRRSGSVSLIKGTVAVAVIVSLTTWLPTFNRLFSILLVPGIIALIVIFQPELRMALERLGRAGLLGRAFTPINLTASEQQNVINEVVEACAEFSDSRTGALIVFERESGLMSITRTGKTLDARVSAELLAAIFYPNAPLHDGGGVIRGSTLVAAACVLPYAEGMGLSASVGMRHRAALGITERTDAVCVVVSEETGQISLAVDGAMNRGLDRTQLTDRLMGLLGPDEEKAPSWMFWRR